MRKYINIILGLVVTLVITFLVGIYSYDKELFLPVISTIDKQVNRFPTEISVDNKDEIFLKIDEFITIREKVLSKSLETFEKYCESIKQDGKITDGSYYKYANALNIEKNYTTSTYNILKKFKDESPYGAYLKEEDEEYFYKKIDLMEDNNKRKLEFLKRKYKDGFAVYKKKYSFENILDKFLYTYDAKDFLETNLEQSDIDDSIYKFRELTLNETKTSYGTVFKAIPELWNSVINKTEYKKPLMSYYLSSFNTIDNKNFKALNRKSKLIVVKILNQGLLARRFGQVFIDLEYFGINDFIGIKTLNKISNMIDISLSNIDKYTKKIKKEEEKINKFNSEGIIYSFDTFTINIKSNEGRRYLKIKIELELSSWSLIEEIDIKTAILKDRIIRLISSKRLYEINSKNGKNKLLKQIINTSNKLLNSGTINSARFIEFKVS